MDDQKQPEIYDIVILGAGWSGLLAAKYCLAEGLTILVLEEHDKVGGVWAFTPQTGRGGVLRNTQTTSSRCITEMSDFPMPENYPNFPSHEQILAYLESYCTAFDLNRYIRFRSKVTRVRRMNPGWEITCSNGSQVISQSLVLCSGVHQTPNDLSHEEPFNGFHGNVYHSSDLKEIGEEFRGKTLVLWGGGETASDIAYGLGGVADQVYWCIPHGQWFVPKIVDHWRPFPSDRPKVVDHTSSRVRLFLSPTHKLSPFISQYLEWNLGFNGHGQEEWRTKAPYNRAFFNKSSESLDYVRSGKIKAKRNILRCDGSTVYFTDGSETQTDAIILCSGFQIAFPAFEPATDAPIADQRQWFKYMWVDPTLALVGFARPIFGSIPGLAELQARYAAQVFSGKLTLPPPCERERVIAKDSAFWNHHFRFTSRRISGLVDHFLYSDQLARLIGCRPQFWKLFMNSPIKWWIAVTSPWNGCQYWLKDETHHEQIFETLSRYRDNLDSEVYTFIVLAPILPLIWVISKLRLTYSEWMDSHRMKSHSRERVR
jgi:thioredoxin reductase